MSVSNIVCEKIGCCGVITLDRPKALNSLSAEMVADIAVGLDAFGKDDGIRSVVIRSSSARAFCSGGDIKALYELGRAGKLRDQLAFFTAEYRLCRKISQYPKPYIALIDGIVMGGGVGISLYGARRIGGEAMSLAMPEVRIGFFPDIGGTYFLPRLAGHFGTYLALTGASISLGDALALGLATDHVPAARFDSLVERFARGEDIDQAIRNEAAPAPEAPLLQQRHFIDGCFAPDTVDDILGAIDEASYAGSNFAMTTYETIAARSPTSLAIARRQMQIGPTLDLDAALRLEFRIAQKVLLGHDYYEGVRTALIDKTDTPRWAPAEIATIKPTDIAAYFAPAAQYELDLSVPAGAA